MKDRFKEFGAEFKNEAELEEELDEEGLKVEEIEKEHFEENGGIENGKKR